MTSQQAQEIIKTQAKLLIHLTERVVLLQVAFEAYVHEQIGESGAAYDAHYARRKALLEQDSKGTTNDLLCTLKQALDKIDN